MAADIPRRELESIDQVLDIYINIGEKGLDANDLGDALRALNLNPTLAFIEKLGGTKKRNEKKITKDEFLQIYATVRKEKEQGCYEDFLECLKLYDKEENGTMLLAELNHILMSLGETLDQEQVDELFKDCMDPEDEEGFIPYAQFLQRMMTSPIKW
ncbi:myosin light chain alkali isoform X3 [Condylostylus longicornis]|uniref:myosin light chain alkali isoform X3 n=1 Tax=Condylostylus longicornis TaxID=2530218 RepID=UPI00244E1F63|nr:myosin light chain alkali isoform X3 [Condylostylus longicornis]